MMVNTIREPDTLQVSLHVHEVRIRTVALVIGIDRFQHLADNQIVLSILVEQDVTALKSRFRQIVNQFLLLQRKLFEPVYFVTEQLQVRKLLYRIIKRLFLLFLIALTTSGQHQRTHHTCHNQLFHFHRLNDETKKGKPRFSFFIISFTPFYFFAFSANTLFR